jgi:hypothetical protein
MDPQNPNIPPRILQQLRMAKFPLPQAQIQPYDPNLPDPLQVLNTLGGFSPSAVISPGLPHVQPMANAGAYGVNGMVAQHPSPAMILNALR